MAFETLEPKQAKEIEEKAVRDFLKKETDKDKQEPKTTDLVRKVKSIFPFQLFPDELLVYKDKVTLTTRVGPAMSQTRDLHLHDIAQVEADVGPVFGHLHVIPKLRTEEPMLIDRLSRSEALRAREIIEDMIEEDQRGRQSSY